MWRPVSTTRPTNSRNRALPTRCGQWPRQIRDPRAEEEVLWSIEDLIVRAWEKREMRSRVEMGQACPRSGKVRQPSDPSWGKSSPKRCASHANSHPRASPASRGLWAGCDASLTSLKPSCCKLITTPSCQTRLRRVSLTSSGASRASSQETTNSYQRSPRPSPSLRSPHTSTHRNSPSSRGPWHASDTKHPPLCCASLRPEQSHSSTTTTTTNTALRRLSPFLSGALLASALNPQTSS
mmetsp:Transcript_2017/g.2784  ORF Transcript_2017/g.2784 Transcript_2017/m.2784 type:complete len:238 (-) Transcript_2017:536-1249(-)